VQIAPPPWLDVLIWAIFPAILILFGLVLSLVLMLIVRRLSQVLFFVPALVLGMSALLMIGRIWLSNAWPTFLPYILTGLMSLVICAQILWYFIRRKSY